MTRRGQYPHLDPTGADTEDGNLRQELGIKGQPATGDAGSGRPGKSDRERLFPEERAEAYGTRWDALKGDFVDEPRHAVDRADQLVSELLEELQELFRTQRQNLEQGLDANDISTEDLRLALRRYRSFFDRLLAV